MTYQIQLAREAEKELEGLDRATLKRVQKRIDELSTNPYSARFSKKLTMATSQRTARAGDWRIIYEVDDAHKRMTILGVRHRRKAYKKLP
jgi:mRNA interferase RelE/StbE